MLKPKFMYWKKNIFIGWLLMVSLGWIQTCWNWKKKCLTLRLKMLGQRTLRQIPCWSRRCRRCRLTFDLRCCWLPHKQCWCRTCWKSRIHCRQIVSLQPPLLIRCFIEILIPRWSQERRNNWWISPLHFGWFISWIGSHTRNSLRIRNPCCFRSCQIRFRY